MREPKEASEGKKVNEFSEYEKMEGKDEGEWKKVR